MEYSFEITRERCLNRVLSIQPSFQYIANGNGKSAVLLARLYCAFEGWGLIWTNKKPPRKVRGGIGFISFGI